MAVKESEGQRINRAWRLWLASETGRKCNDESTLTGQPYLCNRLFHAFEVGIALGREIESESTPLETK